MPSRRAPTVVRDDIRASPAQARKLPRRSLRASQRKRMLAATTEAVARHGYAAASVADVIEGAGVSRKTFYEHFANKEAGFLAAYEGLSARVISAMATAARPHQRAAARRRAQLATFLDTLMADRSIARVFMVDVLGAGDRALQARERINAAFAEAVLGGAVPRLRRAAIVGGVNAVVAGALLEHRAPDLRALLDPLCAFIERALRA
jgi:AcrR family transcriptional regulator